MGDASPVLRLAPDAVVRPMAEGSVVLVGDEPPIVIGALQERLLAVCLRPTEHNELVEVMCELDEFDEEAVRGALAQLIERGVLAVS